MTAAATAAEEEEGNERQRQEIQQNGPSQEIQQSKNLDGGVFGGSTVDLGAGSTIDLGASVASTNDLQETSWDRGLLDASATTGKSWGGVDESLKTNCGGADGDETSCDDLQGYHRGQRVGSAAKRELARKREKEEGESDEGEGVGGQGVENVALSGSAGGAGDPEPAFVVDAESSPRLGQWIERTIDGGGRRVGEIRGSGGVSGSDDYGGGSGGGGGVEGGGEHRARARRQKNANKVSSSSVKIEKDAAPSGSGAQKKNHVPNGATLRDRKKVGALSGQRFTHGVHSVVVVKILQNLSK